MSDIFNAHINEETNEGQTVKEHSENTALLCRQFAIPILKDFMYAMGLLHDVGKYQLSFQRRLKGENIRVEHSTCGAIVAKDLYPNVLALLMEYCIAGHHSGIPDGGYINDTQMCIRDRGLYDFSWKTGGTPYFWKGKCFIRWGRPHNYSI